ncbi:aldo/keto reductase [Campylobacter cuniculorum]|uniref:aldo/keto reductase n=1 Tax=Campylobacter cuniculorum TaxID=374106 RepID=UPI0023F189D1|nr:aldo/keto reductase [Campylobacter cuniculorum]
MQRRKFLKTLALSGALISMPSLANATNSKGIKMRTITLNNGVKMPVLGLGLLNIRDLKECQRVVEDALEVGYRLIDTAQAYANEEAVGAAIKASGIKREELFITTKLFREFATEQKAIPSFEQSCKKLGVDCVDLFLIHQPINDVYGAWRAMTKLYKEKRIRALGVSNFYPDKLVDFVMNNEITPAVNQFVCNPFRQELELAKLLQEYNITYEAFSPFAQGKNNIFSNEILAKIAKKHNKSIAQVILRWLFERNIVSIPKTTSKERMRENLNIFDFNLDESDRKQILTLNTGNVGINHQDPKMIKWLNERSIGESLAHTKKD